MTHRGVSMAASGSDTEIPNRHPVWENVKFLVNNIRQAAAGGGARRRLP